MKAALAAAALLLCAGAAQAQTMPSGYGVDEMAPANVLQQLTNPPDGYVGSMELAPHAIENAPTVGLPHVESLATKADIDAINRKLDWITRCLANHDGSLCKDPPK